MRFTVRDLLWLTVVVTSGTAASGQDAGTISGSVRFEGRAPESLVETGSLPRDKSEAGIRWVAVYLVTPVHSTRQRADVAMFVPVIRSKAGRFEDFVTAVQQGGKVAIRNGDREPLALTATGYDLSLLEVLHSEERLLFEIPPTEKWPIQVMDVLTSGTIPSSCLCRLLTLRLQMKMAVS